MHLLSHNTVKNELYHITENKKPKLIQLLYSVYLLETLFFWHLFLNETFVIYKVLLLIMEVSTILKNYLINSKKQMSYGISFGSFRMIYRAEKQ